ncbi:hypothetical protein [Vibrio sp. SCSIO 43136]|uniref:hypothetical protein n=1 Tax=Vibrio sp. SCSIO 43136 TaxID=2819101 RepID=UPI0020755264|nr:hypothetical protein [Vibrio sp. SCSIO 43136]USD66444.1 hypothetical protein J4N39_06445 [Vibrio sp. SCSIO 43136]
MLWEKLEQVNRLRKQAMANEEFLRSAQEHEHALQSETCPRTGKKRTRTAKPKSMADIYSGTEFGYRDSDLSH